MAHPTICKGAPQRPSRFGFCAMELPLMQQGRFAEPWAAQKEIAATAMAWKIVASVTA